MVHFFFSPCPRPLFLRPLNFFSFGKKGCKKNAKRKSGVVRHKGKNASASFFHPFALLFFFSAAFFFEEKKKQREWVKKNAAEKKRSRVHFVVRSASFFLRMHLRASRTQRKKEARKFKGCTSFFSTKKNA